MSEENKLKQRDFKIKEWAFNHPFIIVLGIIIIAYAGYNFGVWLYSTLH